jgi:RNA polymerase sigma-70 factor (ECF subfamily)
MIPSVVAAIEDIDDRDFMESLYYTYKRLIYSEIRKIVWEDWDVDDILQNTLLRLIAKIPLLRTLGRDQLVNYIISTARNTALNFVRDKKRITQFSFDESIDSLDAYRASDTALERLELIEMMQAVGDAWSRLDEKYKRVLELKYILEQSNEEIAKEFDIGPNSVRMLLTRARSKLKELMADKVGMA